MAIGDSITQGGKRHIEEYTYRLPLQIILYEQGIALDFIGSQTKGLHSDATWPDVAEGIPFDPDHDGYYGNKTADVVRKTIAAYHQDSPPDLALVHLGTNDQKHGNFETTVGNPLRELVRFLRHQNPQVIVLLGHLNFNDSEAATEIRQVVEAVARDLDTKVSPVKTVHHYRGWYENPEHPYADTYDWAHPNIKGQEKMARRWWMAMRSYLQ
jgi:hypothetical protein